MKLFRKLIKNNFLITVLLKVLENSPPIRLAKMKKNDHELPISYRENMKKEREESGI